MSDSRLPNGDSPSRSPEVDYPAAHSMDSTWFAIDKNGFIAQFNTGEAGAMPDHVPGGQDMENFEEQLRQTGLVGEVVFDFAGRRRPGVADGPSFFGGPDPDDSSLVFVRSLDLVQDALREGRAREVRSATDHAVIWRGMSQEEYDRLVAADQLVGMEYYYTYEGMPDSLATRGVYVYGHTCENWIAGPYGREEVPLLPLHVDQLPPAIRQQLKQCRFDEVSFAETAHIQPAEFVACSAWDDRFLGLDGKQYAFGSGGAKVPLDEDADEG
jgi:hypothetical protein